MSKKLSSTKRNLPRSIQNRFTGHEVATEAIREDSGSYTYFALKYHDTVVADARVKKDKMLVIITLSSGGWQTVTTKNRINAFLRGLANEFPFVPDLNVYQRNHTWYISGVEFFDGITIDCSEDGRTLIWSSGKIVARIEDNRVKVA